MISSSSGTVGEARPGTRATRAGAVVRFPLWFRGETAGSPSARAELGSSRIVALVAAFLVLFGVVLRGVQYLTNRSLWLDESMLALNLVERSFAGLLQPLEYNQLAPLGFLWTERLALVLFGNNEYALRLFPFLAGCASLVLFWGVARRVLEPAAALIALACFSASPRLIYFASELKQYSSDIAFALLLLLLGFVIFREGASGRRLAVLAGVGALAAWFSHPSLFIMAGLAVGLSAGALWARDWTTLRQHAMVYLVWGAAAIPSQLLSQSQVPDEMMVFLQEYWADAFMPFPPASGGDAIWLLVTGHKYLASVFALPTPLLALMTGLAIVGCIPIWRLDPRVLLALVVPGAAAVFASALHMYPLAPRVLLYLVPSLVMLMGAGILFTGRLIPSRSGWVSGALATAIVLPLFYVAIEQTPQYRGEIRLPLEYVVRERSGGEALYVFAQGGRSMQYYAPRYGLTPAEYAIGDYLHSDAPPERVIAQMDAYAGSGRVWFLFSGGTANWKSAQIELMVDRLDAIGTRLDEFHFEDSSAYLYHLP